MNKIILMGRLTRNPEVRYTSGENTTAIARFSLAVNRKFAKETDEVKADFFNCVAFGKQGEFVEKYVKQATKVLIIGRVQNDNYTNREGQKVYGVSIMVEEIEFAESKNAAQNNNETSNNVDTPPQQTNDGFMNIPTHLQEELPFN